MRRRTGAFLAIALTISGIACGGGLSEEEYAAEVDSICESTQSYLEQLPALAAEQDLEQAEIVELVQERTDEATQSLEELDPPGELTEEHERLVDFGDVEPPAPEDPEILDYFEEIRGVYATIGAEVCVENIDASVEQVREVQEALAPDAG